MEALPKNVYGGPPKNGTIMTGNNSGKKSFVSCNICRNCKNTNDLFHRRSKVHQRKMTERFRIIRSQMKMIKSDSINIHDEEWSGKEENIYCYFCSEVVPKHKLHDGVMVEFLGYLSHLVSSQHKDMIKSYLKFHERKDKWHQFSKASFELENFIAKIPDAKALYMKKMEILNQKDVMKIKEVELQRQNLLAEAQQLNLGGETSQVINDDGNTFKEGQHQKHFVSTESSVKRTKSNVNQKIGEQNKVPPWLMSNSESGSDQNLVDKPIIGPTMDTLAKHVYKQKKKGLPIKLLTGNFKPSSSFSKSWLPEFGGVWNKGRHRKRKYKMVSKAKRKH